MTRGVVDRLWTGRAARRAAALAGSLIVPALLVTTAPAGADWLVTRAGGRVETQGTWQVKGRLVVFTKADGSLSSLRLSDVDIAASRQATTEAQAAKLKSETEEPPKPEHKKSVRSLTDADFSHKAADDGAPKPDAADKDKEKDKGKEKDKSPEGVKVSSWRQAQRTEGDGLDLFGTLQNEGKELATDVAVKVKLYNETNQVVGTGDAILASTSIPAGGATSFRVPFTGVFAFARAAFEVSNKTLALEPAADDAGKDAKKKTPPSN